MRTGVQSGKPIGRGHPPEDGGAPLKVHFVSTMYPESAEGWRGVFIRNIVAALARRPDVRIGVWAPPGELPGGVQRLTTGRESKWLAWLVGTGGISHLMRQGGVRAVLTPLKLTWLLGRGYRRNRGADLYHVNWLQCALPLPRDRKPALVTVLGNDLRLLKLPLMRLLMRRAMRGRAVAVCPNAEWMEEPLKRAFGDLAEVRTVSFGIDPAWYAISRNTGDVMLGKWIVVSRLTAEKLGPLFEWSKGIFDGADRELHLFGPMEEQVAIPDWVHYHGPASPPDLASEWFPKATGLITLSRHAEGRPQVMLEAMAAGLPIVATDMPAHATLVANGVTGILCSSQAGYSAAVRALEDDETNRRFGESARRMVAERMGTWDDCAARYRRVYNGLLGAGND